MVIVVGLTLVAAYHWYYYGRAGKPGGSISEGSKSSSAMAVAREKVQDAILRLSGVVTFEELRAAIKDAVRLALPNVSEVVVYLYNPDIQELVSADGLTHILPKEGIAADVLVSNERHEIDGIDPVDPLSGLLKSGTKPLEPDRTVICAPVIEKEIDRVIAVIICVCDKLSDTDTKNLEFIEKQLAVCYHRIRKTNVPPADATLIPKGMERATAILKLCAELYDQDAASLQVKVIKYLQEATKAEVGFLILRSEEEDQLFCQVVGERVLEEPIIFPNHEQMDLVQHMEPFYIDDLHHSQTDFMTELLRCEIKTAVYVPVISKVTGTVVAWGCMVNKIGASRFTSEDIETISQCFHYTATVLTSTLAFQKEKKKKKKQKAASATLR